MNDLVLSETKNNPKEFIEEKIENKDNGDENVEINVDILDKSILSISEETKILKDKENRLKIL